MCRTVFYLRCRFFIYVVTFLLALWLFYLRSVFFLICVVVFLLALWLFYLCSVFFLFALWLFYLCCGFFYLRCGICICICICEKHIISTFVDPKPICSLLANAVFFKTSFLDSVTNGIDPTSVASATCSRFYDRYQ